MKPRLRLLMVGPWHEVAMRRHIDWAVEAGAEVLVADFIQPTAAPPTHGFRAVSLLPRAHQAQKLVGNAGNAALRQQIAVLRLRALAEQFNPHVIHSYKLGAYTEACITAGLHPLVVSVWSQLSSFFAGRGTRTQLDWVRRLQTSAQVVLIENPLLYEILTQRFGPALPLSSFPLGIDPAVFHPGYTDQAAAWRFVLDIPEDAGVILSPRGWSAIYGQQEIVQAFAWARQKIAKSLYLVLISLGRTRYPEKIAATVQQTARSLGVAHLLRWAPRVPHDDMPGLYALADVVVNNPVYDTFPSTLLEAAACARPIISSDLPAYRALQLDSYIKFVPPDQPHQLAEAMIELVTQPTAWLDKARRASSYVQATYPEDRYRQQLLQIYYNVGDYTI